jgi:hypothetical protein
MNTSSESSGGRMTRQFRWLLAIALMCWPGQAGAAKDESLKGIGTAPPKHEVLNHTRGGAYFVASDLKNQYDQLLARISNLKSEVAAGKVQGMEAVRQLRELQPQIQELRKEIDERKVLVTPVHFQKQTQRLTFEPGAERMLVITADDVRVIGWDKPHVECVLEKSVLSVEEAEQTGDFDELTLSHRLARVPDLVGKTDDEIDADVKEYSKDEKGEPRTAEKIASHRQWLLQRKDDYAPFASFQGKEVDVLSISGLTHEEGNRWMSTEVRSQGGGGAFGGDWRRDAKLTVYVPHGNGVLLRGCLGSLDVHDLQSPLIVTSAGSRDRNYNGVFTIKGVTGAVSVYDAPLDRLEDIHGSALIHSTVELVNTGTQHEDGKRISYTPAARECTIKNVDGNLTAWFSRSNLKIEGISGKINVMNESGDTQWEARSSLPEAAQRIVSDCGKIDVALKVSALGKLPVFALTGHGNVTTNASQEVLEDTNFGIRDSQGRHRNWRGMRSKRESQPGAFFDDANRPAEALADKDRSPGLDLVSRSGDVSVTVQP